MKNFATAVALALLAGTSLGAAGPALAQSKPKQEKVAPPKLSKPIMKEVMEIQKLQQAGDHAGALAKLDAAKAIPRTEKDDALIMAKLKLYSAQTIKDNAKLEEGLTEAVAAPNIDPEEKINFTKFIAGLASNRKDYQKAWQAYEDYLKAKPDDVDMLVQAASVNSALNNKPRVVELLTKAIDLREAAGQKGDRSWYEFRAQSVIDGNMTDKVMPALLSWVKAFPEPKSYNTAIELTKQRAGNLDNATLIDYGRLMWTAGAMTTAGNYLEYAEAALDRGMPNEAEMVLKAGIDKKLIDPTRQGISEVVKQASSKNAESKAGLAALEKDAKTSPRIALVVADTFANLGQYDKAIPYYKGLVGNTVVDQDTVNLRLGVALMKTGDKAGAKAAFDAVKGSPRQSIAQFYDVLLATA